jgi:hypothetical protein
LPCICRRGVCGAYWGGDRCAQSSVGET